MIVLSAAGMGWQAWHGHLHPMQARSDGNMKQVNTSGGTKAAPREGMQVLWQKVQPLIDCACLDLTTDLELQPCRCSCCVGSLP